MAEGSSPAIFFCVVKLLLRSTLQDCKVSVRKFDVIKGSQMIFYDHRQEMSGKLIKEENLQ